MTDTTVSTLVPSTNRGRYACDDPECGHDLTSGEPITLLLGGHWIKGRIEHSGSDCRPGCYQIADWGNEGTSRQPADPLAASVQPPHDLYRGYSFIAEDGRHRLRPVHRHGSTAFIHGSVPVNTGETRKELARLLGGGGLAHTKPRAVYSQEVSLSILAEKLPGPQEPGGSHATNPLS